MVAVVLLLATPALAYVSPFSGGNLPPGQPVTLASIQDLIVQIYRFIVDIAGVVIVAMLIIAGVMYATAGSNDGQVKNAQATFRAAVWGAIIVLSVGIVISTLQFLINGIPRGSLFY